VHPLGHEVHPQPEQVSILGQFLLGGLDLEVYLDVWGRRLKKVVNFFVRKSAPPDKILATPMQFGSYVTLTLTQWLPYNTNSTHVYPGDIYRMCKYQLPTSRLSKVIVIDIRIHIMPTDRQTHRPNWNYVPHRFSDKWWIKELYLQVHRCTVCACVADMRRALASSKWALFYQIVADLRLRCRLEHNTNWQFCYAQILVVQVSRSLACRPNMLISGKNTSHVGPLGSAIISGSHTSARYQLTVPMPVSVFQPAVFPGGGA